MWITYANLINEWFDAWELFLLSYGFADKNADGKVTFTEKQKCHIINVNETNFSPDGSNSGCGGCPANTITIKLLKARHGTKQVWCLLKSDAWL